MIFRLVFSLIIAFVMSAVVAVISGYQLLGISRDYLNYIHFFDYMKYGVDGLDFSYRFEPGFTLLVYGFSLFDFDDGIIYCGIVGFFIFLKYAAVYSERECLAAFFVFTFYYLSRYLILFEMTTLRAACALSLAFFVFYRRKNYGYRVVDFLMLAAAVAFHYSAIVFLLIYLVKDLSRHRVILLSFLLFLGVYLSKSFALSILPDYLAVFRTYENSTEATFLPIPYLIDLLYLAIMLWLWEKNDIAMKYCALGIGVGAALHFSLVDHSILASRFRELLSVFILIYVVRASMSSSLMVRGLSLLYAIVTGLLNFYIVYYYDPLLS